MDGWKAEHQKLKLFLVAPIPTKPERFFHDGLPHPLHPYIPKQTHNTNTHIPFRDLISTPNIFI
jgi:hypothetical protein